MALEDLVRAGSDFFGALRSLWNYTLDQIRSALMAHFPGQAPQTYWPAAWRGERAREIGDEFDDYPEDRRLLASQLPRPTQAGAPYGYAISVGYGPESGAPTEWRSVYITSPTSLERGDVGQLAAQLAQEILDRETPPPGSRAVASGLVYREHHVIAVTRY